MSEEIIQDAVIETEVQNEEVKANELQESDNIILSGDDSSHKGEDNSDIKEDSNISRKEAKQIEKQENIKALRASRNQFQRERDEYLARIQVLEAAKNKPVENDLDDFEDPQVKEIKQIKSYMSEMAANNSRMKLQTQYPDFGKIVNGESISILKNRFPEIAATLEQSRDIYTTGVSAYNIIKKFGLHISEDYEIKKQRVEDNIAKPRPTSAVKSQSDLSHASDYSDLKDKSVRDEIIRIATERAMG